jgi:endonuclease/exonuclease/phosphatase family metal-dependent hydrolase
MRFKILSYNIHKGFSLTNAELVIHKIREILRHVDADLVFLQEVQGHHTTHGEKWDDYPTASQFEFLADQKWSHYSYGQNASYPKGHHGNAILSKFPIVFQHNVDLTLHSREYRGLQHVDIEIPDSGKKMSLFNTHLNLFHHDRVKQLQIIKKYMEGLKLSSPYLLGGDFNDWHGKLHDEVTKNLPVTETFKLLHGKLLPTFPNFFPTISLDRLYFSGLKPLKAEVLKGDPWMRLSDHLPLLVEFEF